MRRLQELDVLAFRQMLELPCAHNLRRREQLRFDAVRPRLRIRRQLQILFDGFFVQRDLLVQIPIAQWHGLVARRIIRREEAPHRRLKDCRLQFRLRIVARIVQRLNHVGKQWNAPVLVWARRLEQVNHNGQAVRIMRRDALDLLRRHKQRLVDVVFDHPIGDGGCVVVKLYAVDDAIARVWIDERVKAHSVFGRVWAKHVVRAHNAIRLDGAPRERAVWLLPSNEEHVPRQ